MGRQPVGRVQITLGARRARGPDDEPLVACDRRLLVGSWFPFIPAGGLLYGAVYFAFYCP